MPLGIVMRKTPGVTRWITWNWTPVAVLPFAKSAKWKLLRQEGDAEEYHATTLPMTMHAADAEAYMHGLSTKIPSIYVVMRPGAGEADLDFVMATASPYEAQDYADTGEEIVEKVPMPEGVVAFVRDFAEEFYEEEVFVKRKRKNARVDLSEDGKGDARIAQMADVFRAPASRKARLN
jgi:hypothetical protein